MMTTMMMYCFAKRKSSMLENDLGLKCGHSWRMFQSHMTKQFQVDIENSLIREQNFIVSDLLYFRKVNFLTGVQHRAHITTSTGNTSCPSFHNYSSSLGIRGRRGSGLPSYATTLLISRLLGECQMCKLPQHTCGYKTCELHGC